VSVREVELEIPEDACGFLRQAIKRAGGQEVFFLARVTWDPSGDKATLADVEVFARGDSSSVPAILAGAEDWDLAIHNHPTGDLTPSAADLAIAADLGNRSVGFAIIDNDASACYLAVKPFCRREVQLVDEAHVRWLLGPEGPLARGLEGFEHRDGQIEMAVEVARALNEDRVVACEAGTGVGKSFAYLVPAILWALENHERVVVSTGTIHLQEQLVGKDLPFLAKVLPRSFDYALIKGRGNYACKRKIAELSQEFLLVPEAGDREMLEELIAWSKTTQDGSLSDLAWTPPGDVWEKVMSETDKSLKVGCKFYNECFFYQARRRANRVQVVVANHHLFFADLAVRRQTGNFQSDLVLPAYARVIFDEAHHLEDVASEHFGSRLSRVGVRQRLGRMRSKDGHRGALVLVARRLRSLNDPIAAEKIETSYAEPLREAAAAIEGLFDEIDELVEVERRDGALRGLAGEDGDRAKIRTTRDPALEPFWERVREVLGRVRGELERIARMNDSAYQTLARSRVDDAARKSLALELEAFANRLQGFIAALERFVDFDDETQVRWLDTREGGGAGEHAGVGFATAPVSVADELRAAVFEPLRTVVMTSATLSVAGNADFLGERLGFNALPRERFSFSQHPSPFDFEEQALLAAPTDIPDPTEREYENRLPALLLELIEASRGRAFVLFTSHQLLRKTYEALEAALVRLGLRPLAQGQAPRTELLRRFVESGCGVLFGTDSFWEGVDVKGRALEHVIITRLPFRVPTEPLQEARLEDISRRGENPFTRFTVPQAVLRFKQGFGRLIRSRTDRGVVSVLDRRLLVKPYGKVFLASLPPTRLCAASAPVVVERVSEFFARATGRVGEPPR
jgi:ATP-dependent DNA helicase DinG